MWTLLWRPVLGVVGFIPAGSGADGISKYDADPFWSAVLNAGGWFLVGLVALASLGALAAGFATTVLHVQARGRGPHPPEVID
jgi:hypothetical protein